MRESYFCCEVSLNANLKTSGIGGTGGIHPIAKTLDRTMTRVVMVSVALAHVYIGLFGKELTDVKYHANKQ